jgi:hypothetical protein
MIFSRSSIISALGGCNLIWILYWNAFGSWLALTYNIKVKKSVSLALIGKKDHARHQSCFPIIGHQ